MTYAWQERNDNRLSPSPVETLAARKARETADARRWKQALNQTSGEGLTPPRRFSWDAD